MDNTKVIGLTGGIGSGKSTISTILKNLGAYIIDEDIISRLVMKKGEKAYENILKTFGENILKEDGEIDRKKLGKIVFSDISKLDILNKLTHPHMIEYTKKEIEKAKMTHNIIVIDAAILIEMGMLPLVDTLWLVYVDKKTQVERVMQRDNLSEKEALNRINSQMQLDEKIKYADFIIDNTESIKLVEYKVKKEYEKLSQQKSKNNTKKTGIFKSQNNI